MGKEYLFLKGTLFGSLLSLVVIAYILMVVAAWKVFEKAGEKGWKALIPVYNTYIFFKVADCTKYFWIILVVALVEGFIQAGLKVGTPQYALITTAFSIAIIYFQVVFCQCLARKFGKGTGYTLGLFFFPGIFQLILGFGSAKYQKGTK